MDYVAPLVVMDAMRPGVASDSTLIDVPDLKARNIGVEIATTFFVAVLTDLGVALPETDGTLAFKSTPRAHGANTARLLAAIRSKKKQRF